VKRTWSPDWAPHVTGEYADRELDEDGIPMEVEITARCGQCGSTFQRKCASGMNRGWIARFAVAHLHRDPLSEPPRRNDG